MLHHRNFFIYVFLFFSIIPVLMIATCWDRGPSCEDSDRVGEMCFKNFYNLSRDTSKSILDFNEIFTCFSWDSLELGDRGSYRKNPCIIYYQMSLWYHEFEIVQGKNLEGNLDWFDRDRDWQIIYFYSDGKILNEAIIISQLILMFRDLNKYRKSPFFERFDSRFQIHGGEIGGPKGKEHLTFRDVTWFEKGPEE